MILNIIFSINLYEINVKVIIIIIFYFRWRNRLNFFHDKKKLTIYY